MSLERPHRKGTEEKQRTFITYSVDNEPFTTENVPVSVWWIFHCCGARGRTGSMCLLFIFIYLFYLFDCTGLSCSIQTFHCGMYYLVL